MTQAQNGNTVKVHYTGTLDDGSVFDSSDGRDPLEFTVGEGQVIPGFEQGVVGMEPGDSKTLNIPSDEAYGPHRPEGVFEIERAEIPPTISLQEGMRLQANQGGRTIDMTVLEFNDSKVTLDSNHPLAGQDLTFEIELVEVS